jgi:hypothetical protein
MTAITIGGMMTWVAFWYSPTGKWSEAEIITHVMSMIAAVVRSDAIAESGKNRVSIQGGKSA